MDNDNKSRLIVTDVELQHIRCFEQKLFSFKEPVTWVTGLNGAGKTSLFEALYYACYLRSFRATHTNQMIQEGHDTFFVKLAIQNTHPVASRHQLQVGFSSKKRMIRIDQRAISSHKELMDYYRVVSITEDDLELIQEGPQKRRAFLDQTIVINDPSFSNCMRDLRVAVEQKQALLRAPRVDKEMFMIWTEQIQEKSALIKEQRILLLKEMEAQIQQLLLWCDEPDLSVAYSYVTRGSEVSDTQLYEKEVQFRRMVQGAHLDDVVITFQGKASRAYASRGQQKLILFLMKIFQIMSITEKRGPVLILVDDFITDFDQERFKKVSLLLASLNTQIIYTIPNTQLVPTSFFIDQISSEQISISI